MMKLKISRALLFALSVFLAPAAFSQTDTNTPGPIPSLFRLEFAKTNAPLIDFTGSLVATNQTILSASGVPVPLTFLSDVAVTNDAHGRIRGSGPAILIQFGNDQPVAASYKVSGTVTGGGTRPIRAHITLLLAGTDQSVVGVNSQFKVLIRYKLLLDADAWVLAGTARGQVRNTALGSGRIRQDDIAVPVPGSPDGFWAIDLNTLVLNRIGGSGTITTPTGRGLPGVLSGRVGRDGLWHVKFSGTLDGKGSSLKLNLLPNEAGANLQTMRGRILGQTVIQ